MQSSIRRQGPVKLTTGAITVLCVDVVKGDRHTGIAIAGVDTWAVRGDHYFSGNHKCRRDAPKNCTTAAQLHVVDHFLRQCIDNKVSVSFQLTDEPAIDLLRRWRGTEDKHDIYIPRWYPRSGSTLRRLANKVSERRGRIGVEQVITQSAHMEIAQRMGAAVNTALAAPSHNTTAVLERLFYPIIPELAD